MLSATVVVKRTGFRGVLCPMLHRFLHSTIHDLSDQASAGQAGAKRYVCVWAAETAHRLTG